MNKPQLSLALSLSVALQASMLSAQSAPQGAIWQRMSGSPSSAGAGVSKAAQRVSATKTVAKAAKPAAQQVDTIDSAHAMLFLKGKDAGVAPAAALTIHPTLPLDEVAAMPIGASAPSVDVMQAPAVAARENVRPARQMAALPSSALTTASSKQLVAQLAPDHVIAQADHSTLTTQPIPPVVTGTLDFEEYKVTNILDLKVSQSRTFKLKNKIVRTSISDPGIAEPVVVSENQLVLLGKAPGTTTMVLWDDAGNSVALDLRVSRDYSQLQATLREIDPRVIVKTFSVGGSDRVLLTGDVDHPESIIKAFAASNVFMDDRGMNIQVANSRIVAGRIGEQGGTSSGGGQTGQLSSIGSVDKYTFFGNIPSNIGKAQVMVSDGGRVTSLVKVRKVPLIVLHVTFLEMNTSAARELAMNAGFGFSSNSFAFGVGGSASPGVGSAPFLSAPGFREQSAGGVPAGIIAATNTGGQILALPSGGAPATNFALQVPTNNMGASLQPVTFYSTAGITSIGQNITYSPTALLSQANLLGSPGGVTFDATTLGNLVTGVTNMGGPMQQFSVNPTIQGIIGARRARVLAEPTLVTLSGERASFLAGGEIPIQQAVAAAGAAQQSIVFEPFGMRINMIPILQENGTINIEVSPEERLIANELSLTTIGSFGRVPGFTTRKTQTIVELKPGQELYISGLVSANVGREITKMPILGEVPVLGALYRSKAFNKNESELVVSVRPEIILPGTPGQLKLPEEIGRVEGPRDLNMFAVEPTVMDERYYSSGRSERKQKTSPTLPEGAPIPDNE
ncbi:MAG: pilus assembly protein N-terminal domain-containing protein [Candidatus Obscuribacter sp.]|nr:pilus assembly protein N-terminal domain-containing protein [Candidatus Obscuribacter sp.]MBP6591725.1 pilus assembly protein N-terminal domain-containing protein [Candidatus Obscuribacter sp.]